MEREDVIKNLRACLITSKGGVKIENLNRDYKMLIDENIPFRKFGHSNLVEFLKTVPSLRIYNKGSDCFVEAIPSEESAHITRLIARQKTTNKKHKKLGYVRSSRPSRQPVQSHIRNLYPKMSTRNMTNLTYSLMNITDQQNEKPRFIQSNYGITSTSPSTRLKSKQQTPVLPTNQSVQNDSKVDVQEKNNMKAITTPVLSQKPKTVSNNVELFPRKPSLSDRLKVTCTNNIPSLMSLKPNISPSKQSEVLSPLSPGQLLAATQFQQSSLNSLLLTSPQLKQPLLNRPQFPQMNLAQFQQTFGNKPQFKQSLLNSPQFQHSFINSAQFQQPPVNSPNVNKVVSKVQSTDPRDKLEATATALNLPEPVYQILPTTIKNAKTKGLSVFAQVKIGPHGYASYPEEAHTEDEAKKLAANIALLDLIEKYGSPSNLNETKDKNLIKERILSIIDAHPNGIFMHQMPVSYKQQYKEILPVNWENDVEKSPEIVLEKGADNSIILRRSIAAAEQVPNLTSIKTNKVELSPIGQIAPGVLQLPEDEYWVVTVTCVISTTEIWARIIGDGYSDQLDAMSAEMRFHYKIQSPLKPQAIKLGNYYAVLEDDSFHRVRCVDFDSTSGNVTVSFIDHGDEDVYHYTKLQPLEKKFCVLPAQALRLSLSGLEDFSDSDSIVSLIESYLTDRGLYVEVLSRRNDEPSATVIFYDTHGEDDVNLNQELLNKLLEDTVVARKLNVEGKVFEVFISHVEQNGDVYAQVQSENLKLLVNLLNRLISTKLNTRDVENCAVTLVEPSKTYFVSVENNWYRGKVLDFTSCNRLKVFLIDFGKTVVTSKSNLLDLGVLSSVLANYPPQAMKVYLQNIDNTMFNEKMVAKLMELAPKDESLIVKVVSSKFGIPVVELFKRIEPNNMLVSINNTLALKEELTRTQGDGNNNIVKPRKRVDRMNSKLSPNEDEENAKSLKPPKISAIGKDFDVHVTMAAHPGNFTVQPFDNNRLLENMMINLQDACRAYKGPAPTQESVREGKIYAAQHSDGHWYRVCISSILKENMVSVYFCDYGDVSVLPLDKLQPLKSQFLELPYQAIKARLAGIRPINVDWSVQDSLRFQELVVEKNFVSIVVESTPDEISPADIVLGLKLIDTSRTEEDIHIDELLVNEGRAVFV